MLSPGQTFAILEVEFDNVQARFEKGDLNMDKSGKWKWVIMQSE